MPWKVSDVVEQRTRFVKDYETGRYSMAELCRFYQISRQTGYESLRRYQQEGEAGLQAQSRAPRQHPNQTPAEIEEQILQLRYQHPSWGARKLRRYLSDHDTETLWPAQSTLGEILHRHGLTHPQRRRRTAPPYTQPLQHADGPNRVWCADFKGWFRTRDGTRIDPLTISDGYSRYLLRCQAVDQAKTEAVQAIFVATFREYGLPDAIRTDNGPPFASRAIAGLSRLSVQWIKLGIRPERIDAGHPEQNGRHERIHRTLKAETAHPPEANPRAQQRAFHRFLYEYNHVRPHEALQMQTPASCYTRSQRDYPERVPEPEYGTDLEVRRVHLRGQFFWKHQEVFLSETLTGERIGLERIDDRYWCIYFAHVPLARFDSHALRVQNLPDMGYEGIDGELWK
jgi:putative transposase